ncbi:hypothetical protein EDD21DRAFT_449310 [Dissophora ornata]|nr:hypothetical protein BGZ58_004805 [Dissophora ornata]KAI8594535.1 hypothetical protein EDD21DRAFT_449310 [Dissophora ornata]
MSAIATSLQSMRAPLQAAARRQYSSSVSAAGAAGSSGPAVVGYSTRTVTVATGVSFVAGVDLTYVYCTYFRKNDTSA